MEMLSGQRWMPSKTQRRLWRHRSVCKPSVERSSVLLCYGLLLQTAGTLIYFLPGLEARSLSRIKVSQGWILLRAVREGAASGLCPWSADDHLYLCLYIVFPMYVAVFKFPLLIRIQVIFNKGLA